MQTAGSWRDTLPLGRKVAEQEVMLKGLQHLAIARLTLRRLPVGHPDSVEVVGARGQVLKRDDHHIIDFCSDGGAQKT